MRLLRPGRVARTRRPARAVAVAVLVVTASALAPGPPAALRAEHRAPVVGIVDTGIDAGALPDAIDATASRSLVPGEGIEDLDGHGTEMAWIVHRAAPHARIIAVKVFDHDGSTSDGQIAAAIDHLRRSGATVALVSLAGAEPLPRTRDAIEAAQDTMLVVTAAGNDGLDLGTARSYPGSYRLPNLVTVAATDPAGHLLGISNRGGPASVTAPGTIDTCTLGRKPVTSTGTSPAAALVAAAGSSAHGVPDQVRRVHTAHLVAPEPACR